MLIAGKEFPDTPAGYRAAADHVWSLSPVFEADGYELLRQARQMEVERRMRARGVVVMFVAGLAYLAWKLST